MNQPVLMRVLQTHRGLPGDFGRDRNWERTLSADQAVQVHPLDPLHGHEVPMGHDAGVSGLDEVWMFELAHDAQLPFKAGKAHGVANAIGRQELERYGLVEQPVARLEDQPHVTSDLLEDFIVLDHVAWLWSDGRHQWGFSLWTIRGRNSYFLASAGLFFGSDAAEPSGPASFFSALSRARQCQRIPNRQSAPQRTSRAEKIRHPRRERGITFRTGSGFCHMSPPFVVQALACSFVLPRF